MSRIDEIRAGLKGNTSPEIEALFSIITEQEKNIVDLREVIKRRIAEITRLETQIKRAKTYIGIEAYPCPLCEYKEGKFISLCSLHEQIKTLEALNKKAEETLELPKSRLRGIQEAIKPYYNIDKPLMDYINRLCDEGLADYRRKP